MLIRFRPDGGRILRWVILLGIFWFILDYVLDRRPFDSIPHAITDSDVSEMSSATIQGLNDASKPNFLFSNVAHQFCRTHGYAPFHMSSATPRRKVYELLLIDAEIDWLMVRLSTLYEHVDYFIVVEASRTFTNRPKPLNVKENWDRFLAWHPKMIYHELTFPENWNPPRAWDYEDLQRDATFVQVFPTLQGERKPRIGDAIIVADVDEIPRPATVALLRSCHFPRRLTLRSKFYYYSFQFLHRGPEWPHPQATYFASDWATVKPVSLRNGDGGIPVVRDLDKGDLWNAGWHCSSCFANVSNFLHKMESFSHTSLNRQVYRDPNRIADRVRNGKDLWDRPGEVYDRIEDNEDVPRPLLENRERWRYMLDRSGDNAGFQDYP